MYFYLLVDLRDILSSRAPESRCIQRHHAIRQQNEALQIVLLLLVLLKVILHHQQQ
jgi:hypothetical protein